MNISKKLRQAKADLDAVYEAGKKSEYDRFWDAFQQNGERTSYENAFQMWIGENFKPKYDLIFDGDYALSNTFKQSQNFDLSKMTIDRGVKFDTSGATRLNGTFNNSLVGRIPPLDLSNCTSLTQTFNSMHNPSTYPQFVTKEIVLNNVRDDCVFDRTFNSASAVESIVITGTIGQSVNFQWSPLTLESAKSVINHLANLAGTADAGTKSITFSGTTRALLDEAGEIFNGMAWRQYLLSIGWNS
jgi:hypothetical protein